MFVNDQYICPLYTEPNCARLKQS